MSVAHLLDCCSGQSGTPNFLDNLTSFTNLFLSGKALATFAPFMSSANLIPLLKKDGVSIRPIAVGEVLRRLISKCCVKKCSPFASSYLAPLQVGVGVCDGAEALLHTFNRFIRDPTRCNDDTVLALVDFTNAFNRVDRNSMMAQVLDRFPRVAGWVQYTYGTGAHLFAGPSALLATSGCQQGDPLGPLLFSLVLQPLLVRLRDNFSLTTGAYLDDLTIAGSTSDVAAAIRWLQVEGPPFGLHLSLSKTVVWSPSSRDLRPGGLFNDLSHASENGIELLGGAVSTSAPFVASVVQKRVDKCIASLRHMLDLKDPQLCLLLLRACEGMPKLVYAWRTTPPDMLQEAAALFEGEIIEALRWIVVADGPHFSGFHRRLATLPVSLGGLGISLPSDSLQFAFFSSFLSSLPLQNRILGLPAVTELTVESLPLLVSQQLNSFATHVATDNSSPADIVTKVLVQASSSLRDPALPSPKLQLLNARKYYEFEHGKLLRHRHILSKDPETQHRFRAVLDSNSNARASAWLFALPNAGLSQQMSPLEFQAAVSFRLLLPQFSHGTFCNQRTCTAAMDVYGYHSLVCRGHLLPRHNTVRDALYDLLVRARFNPTKDAPVTCLGHQSGRPTALRPADILMSGDDFDNDCVDVTVVSPLVTNNQRAVIVGKAARDAEGMKVRKHSLPCEQAGFGFKAFAVDVFGVLSPDSAKLLDRVKSRMVRETCCAEYKAAAICFRRISFAVQLGVARQLIMSHRIQD
jgi:hypothetical protein